MTIFTEWDCLNFQCVSYQNILVIDLLHITYFVIVLIYTSILLVLLAKVRQITKDKESVNANSIPVLCKQLIHLDYNCGQSKA